eukprot:8458115-Pyramimonas_sp.AAC.1
MIFPTRSENQVRYPGKSGARALSKNGSDAEAILPIIYNISQKATLKVAVLSCAVMCCAVPS